MAHEKLLAGGPPRVEELLVLNYRALKSVELPKLTPLTALLGPNSTGKSTVFDVFNFLSECFKYGLRHAWDRRGPAKELKTRGEVGPVAIRIKYREAPSSPIITYHLAIDEDARGPFVADEWLQWRRGRYGTLGIQTSQVVVPARPEAAGPTDLARCHRPRARPSKGREGSAQPVPPSRSPFEARACLPCSIHAPWARAPQGERIGDQDT